MEQIKLNPSFQEGDQVTIYYGDAGRLDLCIVIGTYIRDGHIYYDLVILTHIDDDGTKNYQRLYRVSQGLLQKDSSLPSIDLRQNRKLSTFEIHNLIHIAANELSKGNYSEVEKIHLSIDKGTH